MSEKTFPRVHIVSVSPYPSSRQLSIVPSRHARTRAYFSK